MTKESKVHYWIVREVDPTRGNQPKDTFKYKWHLYTIIQITTSISSAILQAQSSSFCFVAEILDIHERRITRLFSPEDEESDTIDNDK